MAATESETALYIKPNIVTLVPERREEITTEGGLDVLADLDHIRQVTSRLLQAGIRVSLFIDPDPEQIRASSGCGAGEIELHTGPYAHARGNADLKAGDGNRLADGTRCGLDLGLVVNAGHGLNFHNVCPVAAIPGISELNIGHSIVSQSVFDGLEKATRVMAGQIADASSHPQSYRFDLDRCGC
jgi:pyridoxine 5-phosphate synthase